MVGVATFSNWKEVFGRAALFRLISFSSSSSFSSILTTHQPAKKSIKEINEIFYNFLWSGRGDKIKRSVMINNYPKGGLKMIDIESFSKSLKTTWIKKYLDRGNQAKWKAFLELELQPYGNDAFFSFNLKEEDFNRYFKISDVFFHEILEIWCDLNYKDHLTSLTHFSSQTLWNNSLIRIDRKPIF